MKQTPRRKGFWNARRSVRIQGRGIPVRAGRGWAGLRTTLQEEKRVLVVDIGGGTTDVHCC